MLGDAGHVQTESERPALSGRTHEFVGRNLTQGHRRVELWWATVATASARKNAGQAITLLSPREITRIRFYFLVF